ncbi:MAG: hypothetical protein IH602_07615 [Bryobacteraceae bacterium]|nr:hypothetical protein [Bryobacteraceae bacterium]
METRLTEFSYGYCVTEEFANGMGAGLKAAPYFPSLYVEGKAGGGFDVLIGSALFLQFKLCHELTRGTALECKKGLLPPTFYRFWLHRKDQSDQHKMLMELEQAGNQVYYIAPAFADVDALNRYYVTKQVLANSALFSPLDIGPLPNNKRHRVSFRRGDSTAYFMSEPRKLRARSRPEVVSKAMDHPTVSAWNDVREWLRGVSEKLESIIQERHGRKWQDAVEWSASQQYDEGPLERTAYLARTYFGAELFLAAKPKQQG